MSAWKIASGRERLRFYFVLLPLVAGSTGPATLVKTGVGGSLGKALGSLPSDGGGRADFAS